MNIAKSCGAIIIKDGKFLLIKHSDESGGHWFFPKGHVEYGETEEETAKREVKEETGLDIELIQVFREEVYYVDYKRHVDKISVFFLARPISDEIKLCPIEMAEYKWLDFDEALLQLSYDNSKELLKKAHKFINENKIS